MIEEGVGEDPITNKIQNKNWENKISKYKLDPTLNWRVAELVSVDDKELKLRTIDKKEKLKKELYIQEI